MSMMTTKIGAGSSAGGRDDAAAGRADRPLRARRESSEGRRGDAAGGAAGDWRIVRGPSRRRHAESSEGRRGDAAGGSESSEGRRGVATGGSESSEGRRGVATGGAESSEGRRGVATRNCPRAVAASPRAARSRPRAVAASPRAEIVDRAGLARCPNHWPLHGARPIRPQMVRGRRRRPRSGKMVARSLARRSAVTKQVRVDAAATTWMVRGPRRPFSRQAPRLDCRSLYGHGRGARSVLSPRGYSVEMNRGGAVAATWMFRWGRSRRRRGCHVEVMAAPRLPGGGDVETSPRRRGRDGRSVGTGGPTPQVRRAQGPGLGAARSQGLFEWLAHPGAPRPRRRRFLDRSRPGRVPRRLWRFRTFLIKFFAIALVIGAGLPVGREGPAVYLGACLAHAARRRVATKAGRVDSLR